MLTSCANASTTNTYFTATFDKSPYAKVNIRLEQTDAAVELLDFNAPADTYELVSGDGKVEQNKGRIIWQPPADGGQLSYRVLVESKRKTSAGDIVSDATKTKTWALLRLDDLFPAARVEGARSEKVASYLELQGPERWSFETRYGPVSDKPERILDAGRIYNRPSGWMVAGEIGIRRESISDRIVTVAAPTGMGFPRLDILTFMNWTLPHIVEVFPDFPKRLLVAGAPREMWRGGLSAPGSLYLHIDRPLVSENGTSSLLHEITHVAGIHSAIDEGDWIVEGLAEYYSLLILLRSGGITQSRFDKSLAQLERWADRNKADLKHPSSGAHTARAVVLLHELDKELQTQGADIDKVTRTLLARDEISPGMLRQVTEELLGEPSATLTKYLNN
ncbi:MAG: hypothetical protein AAF993_07845 [Pseudomonadota bacterium]